MKQWFILHVYAGYENKIKEFILKEAKLRGVDEYIDDVHIPVKTVSKISRGKKRRVERKIYPGYVLLSMEPNQELIDLVSNAPGVMPFTGIGKKPCPISEEEAGRALGTQKITEGGGEFPFSKGDSVTIIDGPFTDFTGVIEEIYGDRERLKVMVTIFGRLTPVELNFLQVEPI